MRLKNYREKYVKVVIKNIKEELNLLSDMPSAEIGRNNDGNRTRSVLRG